MHIVADGAPINRAATRILIESFSGFRNPFVSLRVAAYLTAFPFPIYQIGFTGATYHTLVCQI